jgi:replicative superfamily II helicase
MQKYGQVSVKDRFAVVLDFLEDAEERKMDRSAARSCGSHKALETFTPTASHVELGRKASALYIDNNSAKILKLFKTLLAYFI